MQRELKFRVWCPDKNKFLGECSRYSEHYSFGSILRPLEVHKESYGEFVSSLDGEDGPSVIIQQYTGLKDANGKEIYEGDLIQIPGFNGVAQVTFCDNGAFLALEFDILLPLECEVIGNIFENEDLIIKQKNIINYNVNHLS